MTVSVVSLHVYPIKGCRGTALQEAQVTPLGVRYDRGLMLIDSDGARLSQREEPRLALLHPRRDGNVVRVDGPDGGSYIHELRVDGTRRAVRLSRVRTAGIDQGDEVAAWFGDQIGRACRLVSFPDDEVRTVNPTYAVGETAYTDEFPLLVTSLESLADLNTRLDEPLPMNRFRPNVVLSGWDLPWAEDGVRRLRVGGVEIEMVRRCGRCVVTTVDQETAVVGREPLRTLAKFRNVEQSLLFGVLAVPRVTGTISVGDPVEVLESADPFVAV